MRATKYFVIKATTTHEEKSKGGILLLHRFSNQEKVIQYHEVMAVPEKYKDHISPGDTLVVHFNVVVYDRKDGEVKKSGYWIKDDLYFVRDNMAHFAINKKGDIYFLKDDCLVDGETEEEEKVLDSGIILPDLRKDNEKKDGLMKGVVWAVSDKIYDVEIGDHVGMTKYSDYSVKLPDGSTKWFVGYNSMLFKYDD